jgi:hypothetical protein
VSEVWEYGVRFRNVKCSLLYNTGYWNNVEHNPKCHNRLFACPVAEGAYQQLSSDIRVIFSCLHSGFQAHIMCAFCQVLSQFRILISGGQVFGLKAQPCLDSAISLPKCYLRALLETHYKVAGIYTKSFATCANDFANIKYDSAFVTGADIDKYLQHASTFAKHMHRVQIFLYLLCYFL